MTLSQSVSYYWDGQNKAGKAATVAVGALAGWYGAMQAIQIYNTVKSIFIELKNAYARPRQILPHPSSRMPASPTPSWLQLPESV